MSVKRIKTVTHNDVDYDFMVNFKESVYSDTGTFKGWGFFTTVKKDVETRKRAISKIFDKWKDAGFFFSIFAPSIFITFTNNLDSTLLFALAVVTGLIAFLSSLPFLASLLIAIAGSFKGISKTIVSDATSILYAYSDESNDKNKEMITDAQNVYSFINWDERFPYNKETVAYLQDFINTFSNDELTDLVVKGYDHGILNNKVNEAKHLVNENLDSNDFLLSEAKKVLEDLENDLAKLNNVREKTTDEFAAFIDLQKQVKENEEKEKLELKLREALDRDKAIAELTKKKGDDELLKFIANESKVSDNFPKRSVKRSTD